MSIHNNDLGVFGEPIETDKYLYHFTTLSTALEYILKDKVIRLSPLKYVNDPKETTWSFMYDESVNKIEEKEWINIFETFRTHSKVFCACSDINRTREEQSQDMMLYRGRGFNHARMWAQYADNHQGVCIVLDKQKLINNCKKSFDGLEIYYDTVQYSDELFAAENDNPYYIDSELLKTKGHIITAHELIKKHWKHYYFRKLRDWRDEEEFRIVIVDNSVDYIYIDIKNALKGIIVGYQFNDVYLPSLRTIVDDINVRLGRMVWYHGIAQMIELLDE
jgi:hypothetical protein